MRGEKGKIDGNLDEEGWLPDLGPIGGGEEYELRKNQKIGTTTRLHSTGLVLPLYPTPKKQKKHSPVSLLECATFSSPHQSQLTCMCLFHGDMSSDCSQPLVFCGTYLVAKTSSLPHRAPMRCALSTFFSYCKVSMA